MHIIIFISSCMFVCSNSQNSIPNNREDKINILKPIIDIFNKQNAKAIVARKLVHNSKTVFIQTEQRSKFEGFPFTTDEIIIDGNCSHSTGVPYTFLSRKSETALNLVENNRASILVSQENVDGSCHKYDLNAKDPKCVETLLIGKIKKMDKESEEYEYALNAFMEKYPRLKYLDTSDYDLGKMHLITAAFKEDSGKVGWLSIIDYLKANINTTCG